MKTLIISLWRFVETLVTKELHIVITGKNVLISLIVVLLRIGCGRVVLASQQSAICLIIL